ncbi:MAG: alcohol dehydrogenase catalytic domain-containing protein, partial [Acidimicrobiia bacterium]
MSVTISLGELPDLGVVPARMLAQANRTERMGDPRTSFAIEELLVPTPSPTDVLIAVMAAGINFNGVWAAKGVPQNVISVQQKDGDLRDYHVGGSDVSGIVWAVGEKVTKFAIGDHVV